LTHMEEGETWGRGTKICAKRTQKRASPCENAQFREKKEKKFGRGLGGGKIPQPEEPNHCLLWGKRTA